MNILETVVFADNENLSENTVNTATEGQAADGQPDNGQAAAQPNAVMSGIMTFFPFILIIVLLYFMMIRPQRKREKEAKEMINALKVGDKVVSIGGICGKISKIKDDFVIIESGNVGTPDEKSYIKLERDSIKTVEQKKSN